MNIELGCDPAERIHIRALPVKMHRHDGPYVVRRSLEPLLHFCRIQVQRSRINVGKNWLSASTQNRTGCGKKAERRSDDGIARANAGSRQSQPEAVCAGPAANAVCPSAQRSKFTLESGDFLAQDVVLGIADTGNG